MDRAKSSRLQERPVADASTGELLRQARGGEQQAVDALLRRHLPALRRWSHARLPAVARGYQDTADLVQDVASSVLGRLNAFEPRHDGAMQAFLRQAMINRVRDELRRAVRRPPPLELTHDHAGNLTTPLDALLRKETFWKYRQALMGLKAKDRALLVARMELEWPLAEIAKRFGLPTVAAARMSFLRAYRRLAEHAAAGDAKEVARSGRGGRRGTTGAGGSSVAAPGRGKRAGAQRGQQYDRPEKTSPR